MADPLTQVIELLKPRSVFSKEITGAGRWGVRYSAFGQPGFCAVIDGECLLALDGQAPVVLRQGDFVLLPATPAFTLSGFEPVSPKLMDPNVAATLTADIRHGRADGPPDVRLLGGYFCFDTPDAGLLVSLLPAMIHICSADRLAVLVRLVGDEASGQEAGRDLVLARLVEILMIEALRASNRQDSPPGLLRGLADSRIAGALRRMHDAPHRSWTVALLAHEASMSRSAFFERFTRTVGQRPMEYLVAWRMAVAKDLLRSKDVALDEVARRVGYRSANTFSTAFSRHAGQPPGRFSRTRDSPG